MNDLPTPNIPLLRKAVEWAEAEAAKPEPMRHWDQGTWIDREAECGTTYCIAGYTVMQTVQTAEVRDCEHGCCAELWIDGSGPYNWSAEARNLLGLTQGEAFDLFDGTNNIIAVRRIAEQIAARAGERL